MEGRLVECRLRAFASFFFSKRCFFFSLYLSRKVPAATCLGNLRASIITINSKTKIISTIIAIVFILLFAIYTASNKNPLNQAKKESKLINIPCRVKRKLFQKLSFPKEESIWICERNEIKLTLRCFEELMEFFNWNRASCFMLFQIFSDLTTITAI